jgi:hypothetical protein
MLSLSEQKNPQQNNEVSEAFKTIETMKGRADQKRVNLSFWRFEKLFRIIYS